MDVMALVVVGAQVLIYAAIAASRWLTVRSRADLVRAAAELPVGVQVRGRDTAGTWTARRTGKGPKR